MRFSREFLLLLCSAFLLLGSTSAEAQSNLPETVVFNRDIRPILSDKCFHCHGPDKNARKADLRLDTQEGLYSDLGDAKTVRAGDLAKSEIYQRIISTDDDLKMPPVDSDRKLTPREIQLIKRWIEQGATWQRHWSFISVKRPEAPNVKNKDFVRSPIDAFVLNRLNQAGLKPSANATKEKLIRRLNFDLTGLPPTPAEVHAFVHDKSPNAYEKVVDRLLKSSRYGEHMASHWLDVARYADTSGYQNDGPRYMWRWRDWVIDSFNANMPFDQFTVEQLAGDLLPNRTLSQRIATGFNRNHRGNAEGGIIPEEFAVEYVVDRVETTSTVWLGLTMGCVRCHEHKYDPFTQKDFYRIYAYFNNIPENGRAIKEGNSPPYVKAPTDEQRKKIAQLKKQIRQAKKKTQNQQNSLSAAQAAWEKSFSSEQQLDWSVSRGLIAHFNLDDNLQNSEKNQSDKKEAETKIVDGTAKYSPGRIGNAIDLDGKQLISAGNVGNFGYFNKFSFSAWVRPQGNKGGVILSRMTDARREKGYSLRLEKGHLQVNHVVRWLDDCIRVETEQTVPSDKWTHITVTYDGSRLAAGIGVYFNGKRVPLKVHLDTINQTFSNEDPFRIGGGGGPASRFHGQIDDVRVFNVNLSATEAGQIAIPNTINQIVGIPAKKRTVGQRSKLAAYFLEHRAPADIRTAAQNLVALEAEQAQFLENVPTVMVMEELSQPKQTHVLTRGEYDKPGEKVTASIPESLPPMPDGLPNNRLGFARWLVHPSHPLTSRVTVNRFWQMLFGIGLVKTTEDFGAQGELPSHPELLDWLSAEYMSSGWDTKALLKTIVLSNTYRQSSRVTAEVQQRDPENRLLSHGPRFRLPAEMLRDQALAISGMLVERVGGPSVKPYQPAGLWSEIATVGDYQQDHGENLYRRSMYIYWKRTVSPPTMATFDAPSREFCLVRRATTNTPLQALTLMNETSFVEAARVIAQRVMTESGKSPQQRLTLAFELATARKPTAAELKILVAGLKNQLSGFKSDVDSAKKLLAVGEYPVNKKLNPAELAAYTTLCSLIINLDEAVTKE